MKWVKNKNIAIIFSIISLLSSLFLVKDSAAEGNNLILVCPATIETSTTFNCTISATASAPVYTIASKFSTTGAQLVSFSSATNWTGSLSGTTFSTANTSGQSGTITLGTATMKSNASAGDAKIALTNVFFGDKDGEEASAGSTSITISVKAPDIPITPSDDKKEEEKDKEEKEDDKEKEESEKDSDENTNTTVQDSTLKSLIIDGYNLDFSSTKYTYNLSIASDVDSLELSATPTSSSASFKVTNNSNLKDGSVVRITVTNGDSSTIYRIKIAKTEAPISGTTTSSSDSSSQTTIIIIIATVVLFALIGFAAYYFLVLKKKKSTQPTSSPSSSLIEPKSTSMPTIPTSPFMNTPAPIQSTPLPQPLSNPFMNQSPETIQNPTQTPTSDSFAFPTPPKSPISSLAHDNNPFLGDSSELDSLLEPIPTVSANNTQPTVPTQSGLPPAPNQSTIPSPIETSTSGIQPDMRVATPNPTQNPAPQSFSIGQDPLQQKPTQNTQLSIPTIQSAQPTIQSSQSNFQTAMPAPEINPQGSPLSIKNLPFEPTSL